MVILNSCCCWRSVRKGSIACGIYTLIYYTVAAAFVSSQLHEELIYLRSNSTAKPHLSIVDPDTTSPTSIIFTILLLSISAIGIITSLLLLIGLYWNNRILLIPWILTVVGYIMLDIAHCIYLIGINTLGLNPPSAILFTFDFFLILINIYCLLCVISQYQELSAGRGRSNENDRGNLVPTVHYTAQPTTTSFLRRGTTQNETRASPTQSPTGTGPQTSMGTEEQSPNVANRGPRKSVKFDHESPTTNGSTLLEPWNADVPKPPLVKDNADTAPLIETANPVLTIEESTT